MIYLAEGSIKDKSWSSHCGSAGAQRNLHEDEGLIPYLDQWVKALVLPHAAA